MMEINGATNGRAALFAMRQAMQQPQLLVNLLQGSATTATDLRTAPPALSPTAPSVTPTNDSSLGKLIDLLV